eukprot:6190278-Pleurochrysis_carterae.AAC.1
MSSRGQVGGMPSYPSLAAQISGNGEETRSGETFHGASLCICAAKLRAPTERDADGTGPLTKRTH